MNDDFDWEVPEELQPWLEHQRETWKNEHHDEPLYFILKNGKIKPATAEEWREWFSDLKNRQVDKTDITNEPNYPGGNFVSTVCLGISHGFKWDREPILFETMIFGGKYDQNSWRCATYGEAKRNHWEIVNNIKQGIEPNPAEGERPFIELFLEMLEDEDIEEEDV